MTLVLPATRLRAIGSINRTIMLRTNPIGPSCCCPVGPLAYRVPRNMSVECKAGSSLTQKRCEPCESAKDSMDYMGVAMTAMDRQSAEKYMDQLDARWRIFEDDEQHLRLRKVLRTKNFKKALELFQRIGEVAEAEQHHPDLHLEGWNNCTIDLWTHARSGLSENDFIVAAKIDQLDISDLLSKKQPQL